MSAGKNSAEERTGALVPFMEETVAGDGPAGSRRPDVNWVHSGKMVVDETGNPVAAARTVEEARRIAAAINAVYGIPIEALEAWTVGHIQDPMNDLLSELESVVAPPSSEERRAGEDRRKGDRRRAITEVRLDRS